METKEQLVKTIKEWVKIDNEIRKLKTEQNIRKNEQKRISQDLIEVMRKNEIDEFDIKGGKLMYSKTNVKKPITKKNLVTILSKYYNGDISQALEMNKFIMDNREDVVKETIKRSISENH